MGRTLPFRRGVGFMAPTAPLVERIVATPEQIITSDVPRLFVPPSAPIVETYAGPVETLTHEYLTPPASGPMVETFPADPLPPLAPDAPASPDLQPSAPAGGGAIAPASGGVPGWMWLAAGLVVFFVLSDRRR